MNYWLLKSEPNVYAYADLERDGQTVWDGVSNNLAVNYPSPTASGTERAFGSPVVCKPTTNL